MAVIKSIDDPVAHAVVAWVTREQGGRVSGPPTAIMEGSKVVATAVITEVPGGGPGA
jgi:hypothetical protein